MPINMDAAVKAPPRKNAPRKAATPAASAPAVQTKSVTELREEGLNGLGQIVQLVCIGTKQHADAAAIGMHFPPLARETAKLAETNERVGGAIDYLVKIGPYTALITAAMPLVLQLLANHKIVDAGSLMGQGVVPPEILESQMRAQVAAMQMQAQRQNAEALREARELEAEYANYMATETPSPNGNGQAA